MKSIYFNHIPRTGGTTLSKMLYNSGIGECGLNILTPEFSYFKNIEFNEDLVCNSQLIMGHYGSAPSLLSTNIDTITFLRNPVNQVVSMFSKLKYESNRSNATPAVFEIFRSSKFKDDPAKLFREWLYDNRSEEYTNNGQIYNLINTMYPYFYDPKTKEKASIGTQVTVTSENAKEAIDSLLFLGNTESLYSGYANIIDMVNSRFGTNIRKLQKANIENGLSESKEICSGLTTSEIDYILEKNSIDYYYWKVSKNFTK